jgi:hypothetical protein
MNWNRLAEAWPLERLLSWDGFTLFSSLLGVCVIFVLLPLGYFILTRKFDKSFPNGVGPEYDLWFVSLLFRSFTYAFHIVFPSFSKKHPVWKLNYKGYDFYEHAKGYQKVFSVIYVFSWFFLMFVVAPSMLVHDFLLS